MFCLVFDWIAEQVLLCAPRFRSLLLRQGQIRNEIFQGLGLLFALHPFGPNPLPSHWSSFNLIQSYLISFGFRFHQLSEEWPRIGFGIGWKLASNGIGIGLKWDRNGMEIRPWFESNSTEIKKKLDGTLIEIWLEFDWNLVQILQKCNGNLIKIWL